MPVLILSALGVSGGGAQQRPDNGSAPAVSPDGRHIAFIANRDGTNYQLYLIAADGSGETRLTTGGEDVGRPQWSSDGKRLVYTAFAKDSGTLVSIALDGSDPRRLARAPGQNLFLLPGGQRVLFSSGGWTDTQLSVAALDGSDVERISDGAGALWGPALSPDGKRVAYGRSIDHRMQVWVMNTDGTAARAVTHWTGRRFAPTTRLVSRRQTPRHPGRPGRWR